MKYVDLALLSKTCFDPQMLTFGENNDSFTKWERNPRKRNLTAISKYDWMSIYSDNKIIFRVAFSLISSSLSTVFSCVGPNDVH